MGQGEVQSPELERITLMSTLEALTQMGLRALSHLTRPSPSPFPISHMDTHRSGWLHLTLGFSGFAGPFWG